MKNTKTLAAVSVFTFGLILVGCGSAITGNFQTQQSGGPLACSQMGAAAAPITLNITQNGNTVNGTGSNGCMTETLSGTSSGNQITNATLTMTVTNSQGQYGQGQYNQGQYAQPQYGNQYGYQGQYGYGNGQVNYNPGQQGYVNNWGYGGSGQGQYQGQYGQGQYAQGQYGQSQPCVYIGSLAVSGNSITGTLQLQNQQMTMSCSSSVSITGTKTN